MRTFTFYDLKNGNDQTWFFDEHEQFTDEDDIYYENEEEPKESAFATVLKMLIPAVISLVLYFILCKHLYNLRGGFAMGSEIMVPPMLWYLLYRIIDYLF